MDRTHPIHNKRRQINDANKDDLPSIASRIASIPTIDSIAIWLAIPASPSPNAGYCPFKPRVISYPFQATALRTIFMFYYKVVFADKLTDLMEEVTEMGREDWIPQGGITRAVLFGGVFHKRSFMQAMIKNTAKDQELMAKSETPPKTD